LSLKIIGAVLLCVFFVLDVFVRFRLRSIGRKWAFLRGGTLDYGEYLKVRSMYGWSVWPIYLLWSALISGLGLFIAGLLSHR
jgi:hypothetical protein